MRWPASLDTDSRASGKRNYRPRDNARLRWRVTPALNFGHDVINRRIAEPTMAIARIVATSRFRRDPARLGLQKKRRELSPRRRGEVVVMTI